ncbi:amidase [Microvirga sp. W0021]|uniref:Indoleacetamide hydrolase n=1 Tax=Hohaiivirga grylli TaxID=3133970 RepID=A0ABV0BLZ2_9HYPH
MGSCRNKKSVSQLSADIQSGKLDPVDLIEETLSAITAHDDPSIFTAVLTERARNEAKEASARIRLGKSRGVLDGIPVAWKDLFDIAGRTTTAGSVVLKDSPEASHDADVVTALNRAGMVAVGLTNMSEFAFSGLGINPHYGTPHNPNSTDVPRLPGGSSSGAGVAVAAGLVPVAIGTDTGGSVRIPAAFNGVVGYKATRGRYSMKGIVPLAISLDALGPLCLNVQDAIWIDAAMRGQPVADMEALPLRGQSFAIPSNVMFDEAEPEIIEAFEVAVNLVQQAGAHVRRISFPVFDEISKLFARTGALVTAEAYQFHKERLNGPEAALIDARVVARIRLGEKTTPENYAEILEVRARLIKEVRAMLEPDELLLSPTLPHVAPEIAPLCDDDLFFQTNAKTLRNTSIGNFLDWCGVSLPCGMGKVGMPIGFQVAGQAGQDERVLAVALSIEKLLNSPFPKI